MSVLFTFHFALFAPPQAASQLPPDADWRAFETEHFRVTYEAGLEALARRAAGRAERAYGILAAELLPPPRGRVELVVSDNVDFANGYATVFPTNRVVVYAHPPVDRPELGFYQDWLDLVILHELSHVFHLDTSRGIWAELRGALGRNPAFFPSTQSPTWLTEGIATYLESRHTPAGRVRGTLQEMVLRTAMLEDDFFPIDRLSGTPTTWPGASGRYSYGSLFVDHLARRYGPERLPDFVESYAGMILPYRLNAAARRAMGVRLTDAWEEWEAELRTRYAAVADSVRAAGVTEPEILTRAGRVASFPRYSPAGALAYAAATALDQPAIRIVGDDGEERTLQDLSTTEPFGWAPDGASIVYGEQNFVGPYRIHGELREVDLSGADRPLTRGARLGEPDVHPDGRRVVAVANAGGTNVLVLHDRASGETRPITEPALDVHWTLPRWSPRGDLIAATRWTTGALTDVVLVDTTGRIQREVTRDRAVDGAPTWSPDGGWVLYASDRSGISNLYAHEVATGETRQVTNVLTGAFEPTVSPDGRWIAFSYYRSDGYHVARTPFDPARWRAPGPLRAEAVPLPPADTIAWAGGPARRYSAWPSVRPASWAPMLPWLEGLGIGFGMALYGLDVVERHAWGADATLYPGGGRLDGGAAYRYAGWGNPLLDLAAAQRWDVAATRDVSGAELPTPLLERERSAGAGVIWRRRRWSSSASLALAAELSDRELLWDEPGEAGGRTFRDPPADLGAVIQGSLGSARGHGISLGPQEGESLSLRGEIHRDLEPFAGESARRGYGRVTGRARSYHPFALPGFARHVLALRADLAVEEGSAGPGLRVGGASGGALGGALGVPLEVGVLGQGVGFPVRGYPEGAQRGNRALVAAAEYRFPLGRVERGIGVLPLYLERVWGDLFVDLGAAWCAGPCPRPLPNSMPRFTPLPAVGGELNVDLQIGYFATLPLRFGVALPLRGATAREPQAYLRVGRAF